MWKDYFSVTRVEDALQILVERGERSRIVAGATDLIIELDRGIRKDIDTLVDVSRIPGLDSVTLDEDENIHLGPMVTHSHCVSSKLIIERGFPLAQASIEVGAPQIRNRGTVAGNLITASPANDTITPLMAMGSKVTLRSKSEERVIPLEDFYTGVRGIVMRPDEMMVDISFPSMAVNERAMFIKLGLRRAQAIAVINVAVLITFETDNINQFPRKGSTSSLIIDKAVITLGAVAPTIIHAKAAETYLKGRELSDETIQEASRITIQSATPIDDVRASKDYRAEMVRVATLRALRSISTGMERTNFPKNPVLLWGKDDHKQKNHIDHSTHHYDGAPIETRINGREHTYRSGHKKTLLRFLREDVGLIGSKEGCAEGECGACTIFLDGKAVMSCLVPACRAHGADIITIEGLANFGKQYINQDEPEMNRSLHPVQQSFIEDGAVQCGYCTPGFLMSAAKLLEERPKPARSDIEQAISGNLCRCTGYYKIIQAIENASKVEVTNG